MMNMLGDESDYDNYTETSDSEDQDGSESTYGGNAQSILSSLDESIGKIDDFLEYERGFVHGDVVCSIVDPSGQLGRVVDVDMNVDLETSYGELIKDVNSKKLEKVRSFIAGDYVVHGPWLGRVDRVHDVVTILFNDGARCEIMIQDLKMLMPISPELFEDASYPYYPGQRVRIKLPSVSKSMKWLCGSLKGNRNEGIICNVQVGLVHVNWIASVMLTSNSFPPPLLQNPKNLTLLLCFPHANWQLGDWCILPNEYFENASSTVKMPRLGKGAQYYKHMYVIAKTKTKVNVLWQNGSFSVGLDCKTLFPVNDVGDHDFWPGQLVLEKVSSEDADVSNPRLGIVKSVDAQDRTVKVKWKVLEEEASEEMVSAYELMDHPDFSYCIGDFVFRDLTHLENTEDNPQAIEISGEFNNSNLLKKEKDNTDKGHLEESTAYLSCIGNVIGYKDGGIEVRWASGLTSMVQPSEIFGLDRLGDPASVPAITEASSEKDTKELGAHETKYFPNEEKVVNDSAQAYQRDGWRISSFFFPCTSIRSLTFIAASVFGSGASTSLLSFWKGVPEFETRKMQLDVDDLESESLKMKVESAELNGSSTSRIGNSKSEFFKQFDTVDDYSDHHFVNTTCKGSTSQVRRGWLKKVQRDWGILKKDLPDSIYIRVYEERIDLLRACIVGAPGTPYHDGLFFFDILFPSNYPHEPPMVHYISGGLRLNPNLYESGKVCLSLLNTWTGSGTEVWDPESSTILQLLLSLQALVLNDKPYFNEAGYDKQMGRAEGEKNSVTYNENAFVLSCKSMLYLLHRPPKHFEELVEEHFRQRSHFILTACKAYMDGALVGHPFESEKTADAVGQNGCSTGFKIMLGKIFPKLVSGFTDKGIDCGELLK